MSPIQIFMSYARHDDSTPPDLPKAHGFVTFLDRQLTYELRSLGEPLPHIWRDTRHIEPADQFDPLIEEAIDGSALLVVVLSRNWLHRPYCLAELTRFGERWQSEGEAGIRKRIVVVSKHHIDPNQRPALLRGQSGFEFFSGDAGREHDFFARGEIRDPMYPDRVRELSSYLWRTAARMTAAPGQRPPSPKERPRPAAVVTPSNGRSVYLAKPAKDMRDAYLRVIEELQGRGYTVVPDPTAEIPIEGAHAFVDTALAAAELSIHLLGEGEGYKPEDCAPIVPLQLERAAARVSASAGDRGDPAFRRIIWAPKLLEKLLDDGTARAEPGRDPLGVLAKFGAQLDTDKVEGDNMSKFVEFLVQSLERMQGAELALDEIKPDAQVYVYHRPEDKRYAFSLAKALHQKNVEPMLPALEGDAAERNALHRQYLMDCDAVVLCWAESSDVWAKATSRELRDWERLGRKRKFACRGLVAGPPRRDAKSQFLQLLPRSEIDVVVDLMEQDEPSPDALDPLIRVARPHDP
jgi:hypothetical protein